ncbi:3-keto-disaccharide hydrolase [Botrimarina hoheduenensis]|uniref:3-keto-alpha-glucoside-1,2-lyase/3-keto-2-hydroxy-glucal hydratase domain-containing protein n=1 Tax=Botrimarina hoheduenensis TaxID=2528000 RepID=A0A5C5W9B1_9BACT|nr:DUF1080 domain-containing protein [Botrimarina hoheduenensis]TWT47204.1 hypothetical protein Pla111_08160 [Botrimarina hoheduenensis]
MHLSTRLKASPSIVAFVLYASAVSCGAIAEQPIPLFDGKTLQGWQGDLEGWEVVEGSLALIPGQYARIYTSGQYSDFALTFEFRLTAGANNGVALRASGDGDPAYVAMESQILDDTDPSYSKLEPYQYHGSIYGVAPAIRGALKPVGQWNVQTIRCDGPQIAVVLNGSTIVDIDLRTVAPSGVTADGKPHPGLERKSGKIGFLGHADRVFFRSITVTPLD